MATQIYDGPIEQFQPVMLGYVRRIIIVGQDSTHPSIDTLERFEDEIRRQEGVGDINFLIEKQSGHDETIVPNLSGKVFYNGEEIKVYAGWFPVENSEDNLESQIAIILSENEKPSLNSWVRKWKSFFRAEHIDFGAWYGIPRSRSFTKNPGPVFTLTETEFRTLAQTVFNSYTKVVSGE
jgi:hypothetical protein